MSDYDDDEGFDGYRPTTVNPGPWLFLGTAVFCVLSMGLIVPILAAFHKKQHRVAKREAAAADNSPEEQRSFLSFTDETRKILQLAVPYTISNVSSQFFSNVCLIFVSRFIGTREVAAYALVHILVELTDGALHGPIYACTTLCAHAVGADNFTKAGSYIQLAVVLYLLLNVPVMLFWWHYMDDTILYLGWGDHVTAELAQDFVRVYMWSYLVGGVSYSIWQLLDITNHASQGAMISVLWGLSNVAWIGWTSTYSKSSIDLQSIGMIYNLTALFYVGVTLVWAHCAGWLQPFYKGMIGGCAFRDYKAVSTIVSTAIPLAWSSLSSSAEWTILTLFAAHLGPAEVTAWAILGSIWDLFYYISSGFGSAAEIRTSLHLGNNDGAMAQYSTHQSLFFGLLFAAAMSLVLLSLRDLIPQWYTTDETLQSMIYELIPFVGLANLAMAFGMDSWSIVGAMGKYDLGTYISLSSSWGICLPLARVFTYLLNFDLQGLMAALTVGYVTTGSCLAYIVLSTNWDAVAQKVSDDNATVPMHRPSDLKLVPEQASYSLEQMYVPQARHEFATGSVVDDDNVDLDQSKISTSDGEELP